MYDSINDRIYMQDMAGYVYYHNGATWDALGDVSFFKISAGQYTWGIDMCVDMSGNVYAIGNYTNSAGKFFVAKYDGTNWNELGGAGSLDALIDKTMGLCSDKNGNIYATVINTAVVSGSVVIHPFIAKWDGNSWSDITDSNVSLGLIKVMCTDVSGNLYAKGDNGTVPYLAKWDGSNWVLCGDLSSVITKTTIAAVEALCSDKYGNIYYANSAEQQTGKFSVYKWNGNIWQEMSGLANSCLTYSRSNNIGSICIDKNNDLYAGYIADFNCNPLVLKYTAPYLAGVNELENKNEEVKIYPNPANEIINVSLSPAFSKGEGIAVSVYDMLGKEVIQTKSKTHNFQIDVSSLAKGLYIAELRTEGKQAKRVKIVKE